MFDLGFPIQFYLAAALLLGLIIDAGRNYPRKTWAIPALLVYATIAAWYLGDLVTSGSELFRSFHEDTVVRLALWQVMLFLIAYRAVVHWLLPTAESPARHIAVASRLDPVVLRRFFQMLFFAWLALFGIGIILAGGDVLAILWPPTAPEKISMFSRGGIGAGGDFLRSAAGYVYVLICGLFAVVFVLAKGGQRWLALLMVLITWPYFWFDRTRNVMLATLLPSVFCYLIGTRTEWWRKALVILVLIAGVSFWFQQVMRYRSTGEYKMEALTGNADSEPAGEEKAKAEAYAGLDMLGELCYIDYFIAAGMYSPNWGQRYFSEIANVVPRTIWKGKPLIGYDYAYARGFRDETREGDAVHATVATGMIGQGVANFGRFFGVVAAALLMALWTKLLARLWQRRFELLRFLLFVVGCGLTFNMGRDITLLVLWPFVFGFGFVLLIEKYQRRPAWIRRGARPIVRPKESQRVARHSAVTWRTRP